MQRVPHNPITRTRRTMVMSTLLLIALMIGGVVGFTTIGEQRTIGEALWITTNILTTVGAFNLTLSAGEQLWAGMLMLAGVLTVFYVGMNLVAFIVDGELRAMFGRRQLQKQINQLKDHTIVCGYGRMGQALCELLDEQNKAFVIIESDPVKTALADERGFLYLHGDAMTEHVLRSAQPDHAKGLTSCLRSDADNVFVTLTAREINEQLTIIARAENKDTQSKLMRAGASRVICTPVHGANKIMQMLMHPAVAELVELAVSGDDLEVTKVQIEQLPKAHGKTLREVALPTQTGHIIVALVKPDGSRTFNPPADTVLEPDDEMIVIGPIGGTTRMFEVLGGIEGLGGRYLA